MEEQVDVCVSDSEISQQRAATKHPSDTIKVQMNAFSHGVPLKFRSQITN